ncbi:ROK family transcriptional regulator [Saccharopolyspora flava]|uniref:Sugar kinase of the NBD/HSP70 family, may contain an N-terminal HTH domain n=1 Tax=Saccharopolyspora flava TaxID=95161 RepID=A0A1I6SA45_9PSEU|nr:ROK family transcriptional regulator [Saccharopolyspora flava]SFS73812.1 Sugar kinase of the NBD/HSP70 family, may contain an N-terminal HTH domain [Saccharopolyspora flava]
MRMPGEAHAVVRRTHQERVLRALRERGALSRGEIADAVGLSRTTISEITRDLLRDGAVVVVDTDAAQRAGSGRPAERLALDPDSGQFLGVDFGHRRVRVAIADASHEVVASGGQPYSDSAGWPERIRTAFDLIDRLGDERGLHFRALHGIGIGVTGPHPRSSAPHAPEGAFGPGFAAARDDVDVAFAERFGASVIVDNNTRFAALAEALAGDADAENLLYVRLSDGVGGALVIGGRIVAGATGLAGELGHVTVVPGGARCRCGKDGCLETVASVPAVLAACRERGADVGSLDDLARSRDPVVERVLRDTATALGRALGAVAMVFNPAEVVIGGEIARLAPVLVEQVAETAGRELFPWVAAKPRVRCARLADDDGALGALAALFRRSPLLTDHPETAPIRALPA